MTEKVIDRENLRLGGVDYHLIGDLERQTIDQFPPKMVVGDTTRTDQQFVTEWVIADLRGGCGILDMVARDNPDRYYDGTGIATEEAPWLHLGPLKQTLGQGLSAAINKLIWFAGKLYAIRSSSVLRYNSGTGAWDTVTPASGSGWQDAVAWTNSAGTLRLYVCGPSGYSYSTSGDLASWTWVASASDRMTVFDSKLIRGYNNTIAYSLDGTTWTGGVNGGAVATHEKGVPNALMTMPTPDGSEETIVAAFDDGMYFIDFWTGFMSRVLDLTTNQYEYNGRGMMIYRSEAYIPAQWQLLRMGGSTVSPMGLRTGGSVWPYEARIRCLQPVGEKLFALAGYHVMRWNGRGWHPQFVETAGDSLTAMCVGGLMLEADTLVNLYWAGGQGTTFYVHYCQWPASGVRPLDLAGYTYASSQEVITGKFDAGFFNWPKTALAVEITGEDLSATETVTVAYRVDSDTSWTTLGVADTDGVTLLPFPDSSSPVGLAFKRIQLKFTIARGATTTVTPLFSAVFRAFRVPDTLYGWRAYVDLTHQWKGRTPDVLITALETAKATGTLLVMSYFPSGDKYVKVLNFNGGEETGRARKGKFFVQLAELS